MRATAAVNGVRLHYLVEGEGPLVVLLHGWPQTWYCWRKVVGPLAGHLGHRRIALLAGHDRGARVAHRLALDHPGEVERLAVLDVVPTREMFTRPDATIARGYWHWLFHLQPDLPELLVGDNIEAYLRWFFERWTVNRPAVEEAVPEYVRAFTAPGALRAGFDDYRATFPDDLDADEASAAAGQPIRDCGHFLPEEQPDQVAQLLLAFLEN